MLERQPPYEATIGEYPDRAIKLGDEFSERLDKVYEMLQKGGNCDATTVAFTHPKLSDRYKLEHPMYLLTMYTAAKELASLSGEKVERDYFGIFGLDNDKKLEKTDLKRFLCGSNSVWFSTGDARDPITQKYIGYNHILGIVPDQEAEKYVVMDVSGYINPLTPLNIDELYQEIEQLPVGSDYIQGLVAFRERKSQYKKKTKMDKYSYFTS